MDERIVLKTISLKKQQVALIDDEDFERVSQRRWYAFKFPSTWYALSGIHHNCKNRKSAISTISMHRFIMNAQKGQVIDHKNRNGLDNRKANLRCVTQKENGMNRLGWRKHSSRFKGVSFYQDCKKNPWLTRIKANGRTINLGHFPTETLAAKAYDRAALKYFGEYALLNFPGMGPRRKK